MKEKNIKSEDGFVNITGEYGAPAYMSKVGDSDFWEYIEDGIKPLVEVFLNHGVETFGSCQGHFIPGKPIMEANIRYYVNNDKVGNIMKRTTELFKDNNLLVYGTAPEDEGRRTDRISFLISPEKREELNGLIKEYSIFLDEYLTKYQRHLS